MCVWNLGHKGNRKSAAQPTTDDHLPDEVTQDGACAAVSSYRLAQCFEARGVPRMSDSTPRSASCRCPPTAALLCPCFPRQLWTTESQQMWPYEVTQQYGACAALLRPCLLLRQL